MAEVISLIIVIYLSIGFGVLAGDIAGDNESWQDLSLEEQIEILCDIIITWPRCIKETWEDEG